MHPVCFGLRFVGKPRFYREAMLSGGACFRHLSVFAFFLLFISHPLHSTFRPVSILPGAFTDAAMKLLFTVYIAVLAAASLAAFVLYAADKFLAVRGKARIPERYLLGIAAAGGALGAAPGQILFRHKTRKVYFSIVIILSLCLQLLTVAGLYLLGGAV